MIGKMAFGLLPVFPRQGPICPSVKSQTGAERHQPLSVWPYEYKQDRGG